MSKKNIDFQRILKNKNNQKGITLIALVITIVILIILATISINFIFNGGLIDRAEQARDYYQNDEAYTDESVSNLTGYIDGLINGIEGGSGGGGTGGGSAVDQTPTPIEEVTKGQNFSTTTKVADETDDIFYVPGGFAISEESPNEIDDGIVITDGTNEFVWISVPEINTMYTVSDEPITLGASAGVTATTNVYSNLTVRDGDSYDPAVPGADSGIREPDILTSTSYGDASTTENIGINLIQEVLGITGSTNEEILNNFAQSLVDEYNATYTSINTYGGFYIGRYELTGDMNNPTVQAHQPVLDASVAGSWYGLKKACSNVVSSDYAQTTMVYGNQWDQVMSFITDPDAEEGKTEVQVNEDSSEWGNYNNSTGAAQENLGSLQSSRTNEAWQAKNIYDLAGNYFEWTQEASSNYSRLLRGGSYDSSGSAIPASDREAGYGGIPYNSDSRLSSRPALYIVK